MTAETFAELLPSFTFERLTQDIVHLFVCMLSFACIVVLQSSDDVSSSCVSPHYFIGCMDLVKHRHPRTKQQVMTLIEGNLQKTYVPGDPL